MEVIRNLVIILKVSLDNTEGSDKYSILLNAKGYNPYFIPVLDFEYTNLDALQDKITRVNDYSGIVFTSPRAVLATKLSCASCNLNTIWHDQPVYVVGESTQKLVQNELQLNTKGEDTGNANNLADYIIKDKSVYSFSKPLLFPCGNLKKDVLQTTLLNENIHLDPTLVYTTVPNKRFEELFRKVTKNGKIYPEYIVYFSPSGVTFSLPVFKQLNIDTSKIKLIAIGPSTEKSMIENNLKVFSVATKPTPEAVVSAIAP